MRAVATGLARACARAPTPLPLLIHTLTHTLPVRGYKSVLKSLRKQLGQHLLKNPDVVKRIVNAAALQPHETVLEIGPGTGNLTVHMLEQARAVLAVELDDRMYEAVNLRVQHMYAPFVVVCIVYMRMQMRGARWCGGSAGACRLIFSFGLVVVAVLGLRPYDVSYAYVCIHHAIM